MSIPIDTFVEYPYQPWESGPERNAWFSETAESFVYDRDHIVAESIPYASDSVPAGAGIYFLIGPDDTGQFDVLYVGLSIDIPRRLRRHHFNGLPFTHFWCFGGIPGYYLERVEEFYIHKFKPVFNYRFRIICEVMENFL